jgi:hypothetical protein
MAKRVPQYKFLAPKRSTLFPQTNFVSILPPIGVLGTRSGLIRPPLGVAIFSTLVSPISMRYFRLLTLSAVVLAAAISGRIVQRATAADEVQKVEVTPGKPNRPISLHDRLVVGLQARLKSEITFVDAVVTEVQAGHIPQQQVDETFFWARRRAALIRDSRSRRPIVYFEPAMRIRANLLHVSL